MKSPFILIGVLVFSFVVIFQISRFSNKKSVTSKVEDKERIVKTSDGRTESYYLIFTDSGTFKLEDELLHGNFNSSDWYGKIKRDSTYTFTVIGFRIGLFSEYPNIVDIK